jgi:diacylglycerol O-acyltransferase/trehalose O-mycolyltransferase
MRTRAVIWRLSVGAALVGVGLVAGSVASIAGAAQQVTADDGARVVGQTVVGPRTLDLTIQSPALGRTAMARLLLPPDWDAQPYARWPVLYLLHGCCDNYTSWTRETDVAALTGGTDVLVVMPEAGPDGYYSNWLSGPAWETFHTIELRQLLERGYRAGQRRAIAGLSMGGLGAFDYSARHPGMFQAAASYSGALDTTLSQEAINQVTSIVSSNGHDPDALWGDPTKQRLVWAAHNPLDLAFALRGTALFVAAGNGQPGPLDPPGTGFNESEALHGAETSALVDRLRLLHIPATVDLYGPGTHTWPYWQRELHASFPMLMAAVGASAGGGA